jgi:gluconolactonase
MMFDPADVRPLTSGLRFPEGPAVSGDGSVVVPEIEGAAVSAVSPDGTRTVLAEVGGGANGCAFGPDGALYVCNDGGLVFTAADGIRFPGGAHPDGWTGGCLQRVDTDTGAVEDIFTECDGSRIGSLNDIVFDTTGWCYFVDTSRGYIYYADPVGGSIRVAAAGLRSPNGAGLSPDGARLYVSETFTGRLRVFAVTGPGALAEQPDLFARDGAGERYWDGLAVDGAGNVCVADMQGSGIRIISPRGEVLGAFVTPVPDPYVTNLCFGGPDGGTAYVASGGRGLLYQVPWPWPGLRLNFQP